MAFSFVPTKKAIDLVINALMKIKTERRKYNNFFLDFWCYRLNNCCV